MKEIQLLERLIMLQHEFSELYKNDIILGISSERVQVNNEVFEMFAENSEWKLRSLCDKYAHVAATVNGLELVTLYKRTDRRIT
jgi:bisphosphoglycerate-independent phosphoglycerate mutase (AlkP superfamily)